MSPDEARAVLGVGPSASPREIRSAYRRLVRSHHPDVAGPAGTERATRVIEAYRVLVVHGAPAMTPAAPPTAPASPPRTAGPTGTSIPLASPTMAVFERLCEAADVIGDITYVDVSCAILETIVTWDGWPPCSLLVTVEQRGPDTVAQCTLESLSGQPGPPIASVVRELHRVLAALEE
jgi:hypothetical protein